MIGDLVMLALIVLVAVVVSVGLGIVVIAPRIGRVLDRSEPQDKEPGDRPA